MQIIKQCRIIHFFVYICYLLTISICCLTDSSWMASNTVFTNVGSIPHSEPCAPRLSSISLVLPDFAAYTHPFCKHFHQLVVNLVDLAAQVGYAFCCSRVVAYYK